ncbi:MAG: hypothetical protein FWE21_03965 [Defluviitaleaceae bacterium]|nr:hypothetical protein [Defluviitaleaceae bacterium]
MDFTISILGTNFMETLLGRFAVGLAPVLVLVLLFAMVARLARRRNEEKRSRAEDMIAEDDDANQTRPKDVGEELFLHAPVDKLPVKEYTEEQREKPHPAYMWQNKVLAAADKKMLRFETPPSNVELKKMFGRTNLEFVARYEENFVNLIHAMCHWAEALLAAEERDDARKVLEVAVDMGSEISQTYMLLADIYAGDGEEEKLAGLKKLVEGRSFPAKNTTLTYIEGL